MICMKIIAHNVHARFSIKAKILFVHCMVVLLKSKHNITIAQKLQSFLLDISMPWQSYLTPNLLFEIHQRYNI